MIQPQLRHEPHHSRLLARLEGAGRLSENDRRAVASLPMRLQDFAANEDLVLQGDRPTECCVILDGVVCRYKILGDGRRQIMALITPGEMPDLQSLHLERMDHSLAALSRVKAAFIPHQSLSDLIVGSPALGHALWRETLVDGAVFREWMVGMGRRTAYARLAHLFCELTVKFERAQVRRGDRYPLPLTQSELADALGLSVVHVNRVLQQLRRDGAVQVRAGELRILDWGKLAEAGEFTPDYLHLPPR